MEDKDFEKTIATIFGIGGLLACGCGLIAALTVGRVNQMAPSWLADVFSTSSCFITTLVLYIALVLKGKSYSIFSYITALLNGTILFPVMFICAGGYNAGFLFYYYILCIYYALSATKKIKLVPSIINMLEVDVCIVLEHLDMLPPYKSSTVKWVGVIVGFTTSYLFVTVISYFFRQAYEKEKEKYKELALKDGLIGIYNRRTLDIDIQNHNYSCGIMIDIDHFKRVNDTYSHQAGDKCLQDLAEIIKHYCSNEFRLYRYGGEEFFILSRLEKGKTAVILGDIFRDVREHLRVEGEPITISAGMSSLAQVDNMLMIKDADANLYQAKHRGTNRAFIDCSEVLYN